MASVVLKFVLIGAVVLTVQSAAADLIEAWGAHPDLIFIFVTAIALRYGAYAGLAAGFGCGIAQDSLSVGAMGLYALIKSSAGYWIGLWQEGRESAARALGWFTIVTLGMIVQEALVIFIELLGSGADYGYYLMRVGLPSALYTGLIGSLWATASTLRRGRGDIRLPPTHDGRGGIYDGSFRSKSRASTTARTNRVDR